jgi:DMSO/TMAO reductase YedYZ molybdopterin-dependent catalytic subunit
MTEFTCPAQGEVGDPVDRSREPGFWERYGYHNYGDPWRQQRQQGDWSKCLNRHGSGAG